ncbi:MAG: flagellar hook-length control protein FliK [Bacillota bacterium]
MHFQELISNLSHNLQNKSSPAVSGNLMVKDGDFEKLLHQLSIETEGESTGFFKLMRPLILDKFTPIRLKVTDPPQLIEADVLADEGSHPILNNLRESSNLTYAGEHLNVLLTYQALKPPQGDYKAYDTEIAEERSQEFQSLKTEDLISLLKSNSLDSPLISPKGTVANNIGTWQVSAQKAVNQPELEDVLTNQQFIEEAGNFLLKQTTGEKNTAQSRIYSELLLKQQVLASQPEIRMQNPENFQVKEAVPPGNLDINENVSFSKESKNKGSFLFPKKEFFGDFQTVGKDKTSQQPFDVNLFNNTLDKSINKLGSPSLSALQEDVPIKELPDFLQKQIQSRLITNKVDGSQELSIKLKPAELGKLTVQITANNGQVSVKILTENSNVRELVEQNLVQLKHSLSTQGIKCESINVQVGTDSSFNQFMGHQFNPFNHSRQSNKYKNSSFNSDKRNSSEQITEQLRPLGQGGRKQGISKVELFA